MSVTSAGAGTERSVIFGLPRRFIALIWLPAVLAMLFLSTGQQVTPVWLYPVGLVPAVAGWLVFVFRPQLPVRWAVVTVVVLAAGGLVLLLGSNGWTSAASFPLLGAFISGMRLPLRPAVAVAVVIAAATVVVVGPYDTIWDPIIVAGSVGVLLFFGVARRDAARRTEEHEQALVADARAREEHARADAIADRARVARDVHDVLAHSLSALAVQLQGARLMAIRDGAAADTVAQIERAQRLTSDGIAEARRAVRALRAGPSPVDVPAELRGLAAAHPDATVDADEELRLGARGGETVLRTAQEALSNARKHAPGAPVTITLHRDGDDVVLQVVDVTGDSPPADDGQGNGLTGMAERAATVGATLDVGPTDDGWRVALRLPPAGSEPPSGPGESAGSAGSEDIPRDGDERIGA